MPCCRLASASVRPSVPPSLVWRCLFERSVGRSYSPFFLPSFLPCGMQLPCRSLAPVLNSRRLDLARSPAPSFLSPAVGSSFRRPGIRIPHRVRKMETGGRPPNEQAPTGERRTNERTNGEGKDRVRGDESGRAKRTSVRVRGGRSCVKAGTSSERAVGSGCVA